MKAIFDCLCWCRATPENEEYDCRSCSTDPHSSSASSLSSLHQQQNTSPSSVVGASDSHPTDPHSSSASSLSSLHQQEETEDQPSNQTTQAKSNNPPFGTGPVWMEQMQKEIVKVTTGIVQKSVFWPETCPDGPHAKRN